VLRKIYFENVLRETLTKYFTFNRGEEGYLYSCSLATVLSCIDPSVRIVTKSPKNLYLYSPSLWLNPFSRDKVANEVHLLHTKKNFSALRTKPASLSRYRTALKFTTCCSKMALATSTSSTSKAKFSALRTNPAPLSRYRTALKSTTCCSMMMLVTSTSSTPKTQSSPLRT
jgi:hypothetical protein